MQNQYHSPACYISPGRQIGCLYNYPYYKRKHHRRHPMLHIQWELSSTSYYTPGPSREEWQNVKPLFGTMCFHGRIIPVAAGNSFLYNRCAIFRGNSNWLFLLCMDQSRGKQEQKTNEGEKYSHGDLIKLCIHLPEDLIQLFLRIIINDDLSASVTTIPEFYPGTEMRC